MSVIYKGKQYPTVEKLCRAFKVSKHTLHFVQTRLGVLVPDALDLIRLKGTYRRIGKVSLLIWNRVTGETHIVSGFDEAKKITGNAVEAMRDAYIFGIPCNDWFYDDPLDDEDDEADILTESGGEE